MNKRIRNSTIVIFVVFVVSGLQTHTDADPLAYSEPEDCMFIASFFPRTSPFSHSRIKNRLKRKQMSERIDTANRENTELFLKKIRPVTDLIHAMESQSDDYQKILIFWQLGELIFAEKMNHPNNVNYHDFIEKTLSEKTGLARETIRSVELFYIRYKIAATLSQKLKWGHYNVLISIKNNLERDFYQKLAIKKKWTPAELDNAFKKNLYKLRKNQKNSLDSKLLRMDSLAANVTISV